jgi:hypothetical protein
MAGPEGDVDLMKAKLVRVDGKRALGGFAAPDVAFVEVTRWKVGNLDWLRVVVVSKAGRRADFAGFTRAAVAGEVLRRGTALTPNLRGQLADFGGGAEAILAWAEESGFAIRKAPQRP